MNWKWPNFSSKIDQFAKKSTFLRLLTTVFKNFLGNIDPKFFLPSARTGKTLQFDHQFYADWSIQSREILKFVESVKIVTEIEAAIFPLKPFSSFKNALKSK